MNHSPGFLALVADAMTRVKECTPSDVKRRLERSENFAFLDVREDHEYTADHADGAQHLGRGILERDIEARIADKDAPIVLYCGGGYRSALAADNLQKMGYRNVLSMSGGMKAWRDAGYPLSRG